MKCDYFSEIYPDLTSQLNSKFENVMSFNAEYNSNLVNAGSIN